MAAAPERERHGPPGGDEGLVEPVPVREKGVGEHAPEAVGELRVWNSRLGRCVADRGRLQPTMALQVTEGRAPSRRGGDVQRRRRLPLRILALRALRA